MILKNVVPLLCAGLLAGCGPLEGTEPAPGENPDPTGEAKLRVDENGDGSFTATIDASDREAWVGLDLDARKQVDATADAAWDLSFQRFHIRSRGGVNGSGGVEAAVVTGTAFEALTHAPAEGYRADQDDGDDEGTDPDTAFQIGDGWYAYDLATHKVSPREQLYVVRTDSGAFVKLQIERYYDDAGTPAILTVRFAPVEAPKEPVAEGELVVDASSAESWTFVKAGAGVVTASESSSDWDLAFRRTQLRTNSGVSGSGFGGARLATSADFAAIDSAPTVGFVTDTQLPIPGPTPGATFPGNAVLSDWYDYDSTTHQVSPKNVVFLVRTAGGGYAKLRILAYASGKFTVALAPVTWKVETVTLEVDASDNANWIAVDLASGTLPAIDDLSTSAGWDLAIKRTQFRTNSGTSGAGSAAALALTATTLEEVSAAPEAGYEVDAMRPVQGPSGGEYSGNPVLADWFDYDMTTHAVSPKANVFVIRTAGGGYAKLKLLTYSAGKFTLAYAFTGPGSLSF